MAGSQQDASSRLVLPNDMTGSRSGKDAVLANNKLLDAIAGREADDGFHGWNAKVTTIAADDERRACWSTWDGGEDGLHKVLGVVRLREDFDSARGEKR